MWHQFGWTSSIPVRNRCAKPVARAAASVSIVFVKRFLLHLRDLIMKPVGFHWNAVLQYWTYTHSNLFSQTSAVQPCWSVSGGLVKSRFSALLLLQLDVSIGFTRKDTCSLTFRKLTRKHATWFIFNSALRDYTRHGKWTRTWCRSEFMNVSRHPNSIRNMHRFDFAIKVNKSA